MVTEQERLHSVQILERIEQKRKAAGISKAEMYRATGTSSSALSQWRTGLTKPAIRSIDALAKCLGTTSEYLMYGVEKKSVSNDGLTEAQVQLIELIRHATAIEVEVLLAVANKQAEIRQKEGGHP